MVLMQWDSSFSVKVQEIDNQHQQLVKMLNELHDAMKEGKGDYALGKITVELMDYTREHFGTEEKYFDKFDYPETTVHKKEHGKFVQKVSEFKEGLDEGRLGLSIEVITFLVDWLKNHIKGTDMKYSSFFNEKGLK